MKTWALGAATVGLLVMAACSSSSGGDTTGAGAHTTTHSTTTHATGASTTTSGSTTGSTTVSGDPCQAPTSGADCAQCATSDSCFMCLITIEPAGNQAFNFDVTKECGCTAGSVCATACTGDPACTDPTKTPAMACDMCLSGMVMKGDPCIAKLQMDCMMDTACKQFLTDAQPCLSLP